ncbi:hypothetical protein B0H11DRAFT_1927190 [Mycena galericulata]|nr:hypothetical protein B0H11DRAFT_1927190 [Mycena galericulata]
MALKCEENNVICRQQKNRFDPYDMGGRPYLRENERKVMVQGAFMPSRKISIFTLLIISPKCWGKIGLNERFPMVLDSSDSVEGLWRYGPPTSGQQNAQKVTKSHARQLF